VNHAIEDAHQVGSTIKPLLAAGFALAWRPGERADPLGLHVNCAGSMGSPDGGQAANVPGTRVPLADFDDEVHGAAVGFRRFIAESCNSFMFRLGAEALLATPRFQPADCVSRLGDRVGRDPADHPSSAQAARALGPLGRYAWLTGAFLHDPESFGAGRRFPAAWHPFNEEVAAVTGRLGCPVNLTRSLGAISPAVVSLDARGLSYCVPDFSSLLKGGGTNAWTNIGLANAYARLFGGRAVQPRLLRFRPPSNAPATFAPSDCSVSVACADPARFERVRAEVMAGMGAGLVSGTSKAMQPAIRAALADLHRATGRHWGAYAKTGTSDSAREHVTRVDNRLRPLDRRSDPDLKEVNYTLAFVECAREDSGRRDHGLGCDRLPALGQPLRGVVMHTWIEAVPGYRFGAHAGRLYLTREGRSLLGRVTAFLEDQR
jgi:hypothetical protein